jgi:hypothetical protein
MCWQVLESFKERGDCTDYALYIMTTPNPAHTDPVRFFALQCLGKVRFLCVYYVTTHM